ncbi:hypothetical protein SK128_014402, partial [Halocaridina rubra]
SRERNRYLDDRASDTWQRDAGGLWQRKCTLVFSLRRAPKALTTRSWPGSTIQRPNAKKE